MLLADGIDPNELLGALETGKNAPSVRRVRRNILTPTKTVKRNHGPVRAVPQLRLKALDAGKSLDSFLIK